MSDEYNYNPYDYGKKSEPEFAEPDIEIPESEFEESNCEEPKKTTTQEEYVPRYDYSYVDNQPKQNAQKKKTGIGRKILLTVCLAVIFGVVTCAVFQVGNRVSNALFGKLNGEDNSRPVGSTQISANSGTTVNSNVADVTESVMPSVVSIINLSVQEVWLFLPLRLQLLSIQKHLPEYHNIDVIPAKQ